MGMKASSGLFKGTKGYGLSQEPENSLSEVNTSIVWLHISPTSNNYPGTALPKSFNIDTPAGVMWTHGNATEHMYEALSSIKMNPQIKNSNPDLYVQFILYDYYLSLGEAVKSGIPYDTLIVEGNWEFVFRKPRREGLNPVVVHAKFSGLK